MDTDPATAGGGRGPREDSPDSETEIVRELRGTAPWTPERIRALAAREIQAAAEPARAERNARAVDLLSELVPALHTSVLIDVSIPDLALAAASGLDLSSADGLVGAVRVLAEIAVDLNNQVRRTGDPVTVGFRPGQAAVAVADASRFGRHVVDEIVVRRALVRVSERPLPIAVHGGDEMLAVMREVIAVRRAWFARNGVPALLLPELAEFDLQTASHDLSPAGPGP
ncbi:MAG: hypothetical protein LBV34_25200, partial [Nocardiopsaceae bacterium]|nr:hypothetical protein [Nocardiopsaceae bacterium]